MLCRPEAHASPSMQQSLLMAPPNSLSHELPLPLHLQGSAGFSILLSVGITFSLLFKRHPCSILAASPREFAMVLNPASQGWAPILILSLILLYVLSPCLSSLRSTLRHIPRLLSAWTLYKHPAAPPPCQTAAAPCWPGLGDVVSSSGLGWLSSSFFFWGSVL